MMRENLVACALGLCSMALASCTSQPAAPSRVPGSAATAAATDSRAGGPGNAPGAVYVTSQDMCYDTFATAARLPMKGPFQLLEAGATEYGPGDPGYRGGRWWVDLNGNGMQDENDRFFLCPLLPPGRPGSC